MNQGDETFADETPDRVRRLCADALVDEGCSVASGVLNCPWAGLPPEPLPPAPDGDAAVAAAVCRGPIICGEGGTTRASGAALAAARSVRRARNTGPLTNRTSRAPRSTLTSLRRIPSMNSSPATTASSRPRSRATGSDSTPRPRPAAVRR